MTAGDRINMNKFWNEMEDFYDRWNSQTKLNTTADCDIEVERVLNYAGTVPVLTNDNEEDDVSCYCSGSSSSRSPSPSLPSPPSIFQAKMMLEIMDRFNG